MKEDIIRFFNVLTYKSTSHHYLLEFDGPIPDTYCACVHRFKGTRDLIGYRFGDKQSK